MGRDSLIEWTDHTFNPWIGCEKVSPGCKNCYAEAYDKRVGGVPKAQRNPNGNGEAELRWGPKAPRTRTSAAYWRQPLKWNDAAISAPLGVRPRVFCASLADVFEDRTELVPWREDLFGLIAATPHLDWLLLTKRPENIARLWPGLYRRESLLTQCPPPSANAWPNVWLGTTAENQEEADRRLPHLQALDASVLFVSVEPQLELVQLRKAIVTGRAIDWLICGGESGHGARPFDVHWARSLREECSALSIAFFMKQLGVVTRMSGADAGGDPNDNESVPMRFLKKQAGDLQFIPKDLRIRQFPEVHRGA